MMRRILVFIPAFNAKFTISGTVDCVINQTVAVDEIILMADSFSDQTTHGVQGVVLRNLENVQDGATVSDLVAGSIQRFLRRRCVVPFFDMVLFGLLLQVVIRWVPHALGRLCHPPSTGELGRRSTGSSVWAYSSLFSRRVHL